MKHLFRGCGIFARTGGTTRIAMLTEGRTVNIVRLDRSPAGSISAGSISIWSRRRTALRIHTLTYTLYHNARCGKSRQTLELLRERGIEPCIVEYLKTPPDAAELR